MNLRRMGGREKD